MVLMSAGNVDAVRLRPWNSTMKEISMKIEGDLVDISKLCDFADIEQIKKIYKVKEPELSVGTLEDALLCRMASKEFVTF